MLHLDMGRAQLTAIFVQAKPGNVGPKSLPTGRVWCGGDSSKANCCNFRRRRLSLSPVLSIVVAGKLQLLNRLFPKQCAYMLSILDVWTQVAASHWTFSCNKLAKCQTSVLAADSGDGSRQLWRGGVGVALALLAAGIAAVALVAGTWQSLYWAGF
jgi:hypothetical protein